MTVSSRYIYVVVSTLVSLTVFGRNLMLMGLFDLAQVGQIAMMQTIIMMVGLLQIGLLSGAYILWVDGDDKLKCAMVNILYGWMLVCTLLFSAGLGFLGWNSFAPTVVKEVLIIGLIAGIAQLGSSWINNALVAEQKLVGNSWLNIIAISASFILALTTLWNNLLIIALFSIALQPLILIIGAVIYYTDFRPTFKAFDYNVIRKMLGLGLQPFIGSLALLLVYQLERWSIVINLGSEQLGIYYIVIIYLAFFLVIPSAILNVHFPRAKLALLQGDILTFHKIRQQHMMELALFAMIALVAQIIFLEKIVGIFLPQYSSSVNLLSLAFFAGFIAMLQDLGTIILFSIDKTRSTLIAGVLNLTSFTLAIIALQLLDIFTLEAVLISRILATIASASWLLISGRLALINYLKSISY